MNVVLSSVYVRVLHLQVYDVTYNTLNWQI